MRKSLVIFTILFIATILASQFSVIDADAQTRRSPRTSRPKASPTPQATPQATPTPPKATPQDQNLWDEASRINTKESYGFYLSDQPNGVFREEARRRVVALEEAEEALKWNEAKALNTKFSYEKYLREHPGGRFIEEAYEKFSGFKTAEERDQWKRASEDNDSAGYRRYLERYPYGEFAGIARLRLSALGVPLPVLTRSNSLGMQFSWIPPGSFLMGNPRSMRLLSRRRGVSLGEDFDFSFIYEGYQLLITIRQGFWMGQYEVTQGQYEAVMGTNPSRYKECGKDCPVETVSWHDAKAFIARLNARNDGFVYSLPSEAEWEYAANTGRTTKEVWRCIKSGDANFGALCNDKFSLDSSPANRIPDRDPPPAAKISKVGSYKPNPWALYDMIGNVEEWVEDIWRSDRAVDIWRGDYEDLPTDGSANTIMGDPRLRVTRGGSYSWERHSLRDSGNATGKSSTAGFRIIARPK